MNLLFDFICVRDKNGAAEYTRRIFFELLKKIQDECLPIRIFALYDSREEIAYQDMREERLVEKIIFVDAAGGIDAVCRENNIDRFFIGSAQGFYRYPEIENVECGVVCVAHDLFRQEGYNSKSEVIYKLISDDAEKVKKDICLKDRLKLQNVFGLPKYDNFSFWYVSTGGNRQFEDSLAYMQRMVNLYKKNKRFRWVTVSEYSKSSIIYNFRIPREDIKVLYSPERLLKEGDMENTVLRQLVDTGKKYYLIVSANRTSKNASKAIKAFKIYAESHQDAYLVTVGYEQKKFANHICLPFLSECDLSYAYRYCYALIFPSFFEGFGYPPIEAMHYGKPVLCSNATSMPEILGEAPVYFSPLYESAIFDALCRLDESNYSDCVRKSVEAYNRIKTRQEADLCELLSILTEM